MKKLLWGAGIALAAAMSMPAGAAYYDFTNWIESTTGTVSPGSPGDTVTTATTATLIGGDSGDPDIFGACQTQFVEPCTIQLSIAVLPGENHFKFHWEYQTADLVALFDPFGYLLNGVPVQLTNDLLSGPQSGDEFVLLNGATTFGFYIDCTSCDFGPATATITNFSVPEPGTLALLGLALAGLGVASRRSRVA